KDKKVRREYFNSNGALSKVQLLDKNSNKTIFETYYTVQGKACIFKHINEKNQQAEYIQLVDANGDIYASFDKEEQFIEYWLKSILKDEEEHYLIIDKQRVYYPFLKNWNANNIYRISCIHRTHIKNGKKKQQAEYIQLVDANSDIYASFDKEEQFIEYWLKSILKDEEEHYLIIDKQRVYYPFLKNWNANNIYRISCIHSTHIKNGK